jgi:hypothetical protein
MNIHRFVRANLLVTHTADSLGFDRSNFWSMFHNFPSPSPWLLASTSPRGLAIVHYACLRVWCQAPFPAYPTRSSVLRSTSLKFIFCLHRLYHCSPGRLMKFQNSSKCPSSCHKQILFSYDSVGFLNYFPWRLLFFTRAFKLWVQTRLSPQPPPHPTRLDGACLSYRGFELLRPASPSSSPCALSPSVHGKSCWN